MRVLIAKTKTMCEEEELPNVLNKLEIGPIIPQIKLMDSNLPVSLNPFYSESNEEPSGLNKKDELFGEVKCSCRMRRRSESVLDDCKTPAPLPTFTRIEHTIKNLTQFKHKNRKKVILREPILKSLQTCLHPRHLKTFGDISSGITNKNIAIQSADQEYESCTTIEALNLDNTISSLRINPVEPKSRGITNFHDLIAECQSLLETNFNFNSWNASIASRKAQKNFNVLQTVDDRSHKSKQCKTNRKRSDHVENLNREEGAKHTGNSNTRTSCSQQARISTSTVASRSHSSSIAGSASSCDVTIDELASYFETFVHIPKKMSSMAEMMYI